MTIPRLASCQVLLVPLVARWPFVREAVRRDAAHPEQCTQKKGEARPEVVVQPGNAGKRTLARPGYAASPFLERTAVLTPDGRVTEHSVPPSSGNSSEISPPWRLATSRAM